MTDHGQSRRGDPKTARDAALNVKPGSARHALLLAHSKADGLTDEQAAINAGLSLTSEYASLCAELMRSGFLVDTPLTVLGLIEQRRMVRRITFDGLDALGARPEFGSPAWVRQARG